MNAKRNFAILLALCLMLIVVGCGESEVNDIVLESKAGDAIITISGGAFNINADECISILNDGIEEKGLQPISKKFDTVSKGGVTLYRSIIDEVMELRLYAFNETNNAISVIEFARIDDIKETDENGTLISEEERNRTLEYYKVLTNDVDPRFNVDPFMRTGETGEKKYTLDHISYNYFSYNQEMVENEEQLLQLYTVTTNSDMYYDSSNVRTDLIVELYDRDHGIK